MFLCPYCGFLSFRFYKSARLFTELVYIATRDYHGRVTAAVEKEAHDFDKMVECPLCYINEEEPDVEDFLVEILENGDIYIDKEFSGSYFGRYENPNIQQ